LLQRYSIIQFMDIVPLLLMVSFFTPAAADQNKIVGTILSDATMSLFNKRFTIILFGGFLRPACGGYISLFLI